MQQNQQHFGQAKDTPFNVPPLSTEVDCKSSTRTVECVLEGEHDDMLIEECGQLKEATADFIDNLERDAEEGVIRECIAVKEFTDKFKNLEQNDINITVWI